ncbi:DEAD/DEAH box helicase, putative [Plasmodium reichenowi]|uniref:DEAD/DEAH box helicase, putative n=1 Tax=Plasmodium reichenowi TaxID=5854 RepID=A0A151L4L7_PLARE|nr:DEAD/DEAH box helicase, putative [Plasmodium reichenowi]KYN93905.1 DEAD/DEAH box helicase, putative [Plasmodium reichenowi]
MNKNWIQNLENIIDKNKIFEWDEKKNEKLKDVCKNLIKKDYSIDHYVTNPIIIDNYKKEKIKELYEWQDECLRELRKVNWEKGENFICVAPTSGGKTLVTELFIFEEIKNRKKQIFFLFPLNSLINEKMIYLKNICKGTNIRIGVEIEENDIILCTYEKFNNYLNKRKLYDDNKSDKYNIKSNISSNCSNNNNNSEDLKNDNIIVIIDEFHHINEKGRGIYIENIVSKILYMNKKICHIKIICMSGTLNNISILKKWMKAKFYISTYRPQEIKEHYVCNFNVYKKVQDGKFYNTCNLFSFNDTCYDEKVQKNESASFQNQKFHETNRMNTSKSSLQYLNKDINIYNNNNNNIDMMVMNSSHLFMAGGQEERKQSSGNNKRSSYNRGRSYSYEPNNNKRINCNHSSKYSSSNNNTVSYSYFSSVEESDTINNYNDNNNGNYNDNYNDNNYYNDNNNDNYNDNNNDNYNDNNNNNYNDNYNDNNNNYYNDNYNSMNNMCPSILNHNRSYSSYNNMHLSNISLTYTCNKNNYPNNMRSSGHNNMHHNINHQENYRNENSCNNLSANGSYIDNHHLNNNNDKCNYERMLNNKNQIKNPIYSCHNDSISNIKNSQHLSQSKYVHTEKKGSLDDHINYIIKEKEKLICETNSKNSIMCFLNKKNQNKNKYNTLNTSLINSLLYFSLHSYINNLNTLIFCSTKKMCEFYINLINEYLSTLRSLPIPEYIEMKRKELKEKIYNIDKCIYEKMHKLISNGVCYYYSDISHSIKRLLEIAYKEKTLFLLTCTSTLSVGLNLFVDRVIISSPFVAQNFLTNTQYKQMIGRAARLKKGDSFIFVDKEYEKKMLNIFKETFTNIKSTMHANTFEELEKYVIEFLCLYNEKEYISFYDIIHMFSFSLYYTETILNTLKQEMNASPSIYTYKEGKDQKDIPAIRVKRIFDTLHRDSTSTEETATKRKNHNKEDDYMDENIYCVGNIYGDDDKNVENSYTLYNNNQRGFTHGENVSPISKTEEDKKENKNEILKENIHTSYSFYFNINLNYFTCDEILFYHNKKNEIYKVLDNLLKHKCIEIHNEKIKITNFCRSLCISNLNLSIGVDLINEIRMYDKIYLYNKFHLCYICSSYNINIVSFNYEFSHIKNLLSLISDNYTKNIIFQTLNFDSDLINMLNLNSQHNQKKKTYFSNSQLERKYSKLYLSILLFLYLNEEDMKIIFSIYKITPDILKSILQHTYMYINILISFFDNLNEWILVCLLKKFLQNFKSSKKLSIYAGKFKKGKRYDQMK